MNLESHISTLLYSQDCVIVPGFGAFLAQKNPSTLKNGTINPPSKNLGFNVNLQKSDGLLIQTLAGHHHLSFEEAQSEVETQVNFWKNHLETNESLTLNHLGRLTKDAAGNLEFHADNKNYLLDSFGLESIRAKHIMHPVQQSHSSAGWWKVAAVIPILIGGYLYFGKPQPVADFVNEQWSGFVAPIIQSQDVVSEIPTASVEVMEPIVTESLVMETPAHDYQVIAGAFRVQSEAEILEQKLRDQGFEKAQFTQKKGNYFYVAFETFQTKDQALEYRKSVLDKFPETWVLSLKD